MFSETPPAFDVIMSTIRQFQSAFRDRLKQ